MENLDRFKELVMRIETFSNERDWQQFHDPKNIAISLLLEASEVLELFQWSKDNEINKRKESELSDELADVFYWLIKLAKHYKIDLFDALEVKMDKNERKYPVEKARGKSDKYNDL